MNHIRDCLPELKVKLSKMLTETQTELNSYGDSILDGQNSRGGLLLDVITKFSTDYKSTIEGTSGNYTIHELYGGARINFIFNDIFAECLNRINPLEGLTHNDIRTAIRNATGPKAALFVPEAAFELLVKRQIMRLEEPSLQCVDLVFDELQRIVNQLESKELQRFAKLRERVVDVTNELLRKCRVPTKKMISNLISVEMSYVNTSHPDFVGGGGAFYRIFETMAQNQQNGEMNDAQSQQLQLQQQQMQFQQQQQSQQQFQQQQPPQQLPQQQQQQQFPQQPMQGQQINPQRPGQNQANPPRPQQMQQPQQPQPNRRSPNPNAPQGGQGGFYNVYFGNNSAQVTASGTGGGPGGQGPGQGGPPAQQQSTSAVGGQRGVEKLTAVPSQITPGRVQTDKEKFECELIQTLLVSYFDIVRKNVKDLTPKTIMHFLVNNSKDSMQNELVSALYREDLFEPLLEESPVVAQRRAQCKQMLEVLKRGNGILNEVRDFAIK
jgi:dynamin 1-like protein